MKVLIAGSGGQLGLALQATSPDTVEIFAPPEQAFDITSESAIKAVLDDCSPDLLINAAAYTAVDKAEADEATARLVNATAVDFLVSQAEARACGFVHVSTDFVFDGNSSQPYLPGDPTCPLSVYGQTKLDGERFALRYDRTTLVRTAWVYGPAGANFVRTMIRLMAERAELSVVADQIGTPTHVFGLAEVIWALVLQNAPPGVYHHTDSGVASWYDFAVAIQEEALAAGLLRRSIPIIPIRTEDYPTPAQRPRFSVLDKSAVIAATGIIAPHWRQRLRAMLQEEKQNG